MTVGRLPVYLSTFAQARVPTTFRDAKVVMRNLGLTQQSLRAWKNLPVLTLGEGLSGFGRAAQKAGAKVVAVDPVYSRFSSEPPPSTLGKIALPRALANLVAVNQWMGQAANRLLGTGLVATLDHWEIHPKRLPDLLIAGKLPQLPFADRTFAVVIAAWLFTHFEGGFSENLRESLRVLKPGGELRFNLWEEGHVRDRMPDHLDLMERALKAQPGIRYQWHDSSETIPAFCRQAMRHHGYYVVCKT